MRNAWFGGNAIYVLGFNGLVSLLHVFEVFPYFYTLFYPLFCLLALLIAVMGVWERDKNKTPGWIASVLAFGALTHWIVMLVIRLQV